MLKVSVLNECGYKEAITGLSLSYGVDFERAERASMRLYNKGEGHNKFLESMYVWLDVTAPRYWWQEADTYRVGVSKQSESTMHTIMKNEFTQGTFSEPIPEEIINILNKLREDKDFKTIKVVLPEAFLQRRIWCLNYMNIRNIVKQRRNHRLDEWKFFCDYLVKNIAYKKYVEDLIETS